MARPVNKNLKSAIEKLLFDHNLYGSELVTMGYFNSTSTIYKAMKQDVRALRLTTILCISKAVHLNSGETVNRSLELQKVFLPKNPLKLKL